MLYLRCLQAFSDNLQSCHFPVYHSINSYIFLSKFSNFLVITSLENRLSKNLIIRLFLILFSIILSYYASFAILFISSFASINPRCVYTFNVTPISECPIKYWSAFGFIPAFAILEQYVFDTSTPLPLNLEGIGVSFFQLFIHNRLMNSKRLIFRYDRKIPDYFSVAGAP